MKCRVCDGHGDVCDHCKGAMSSYRECDECGKEFCCPLSTVPEHLRAEMDCFAGHPCVDGVAHV
jgi:hypothetical protein